MNPSRRAVAMLSLLAALLLVAGAHRDEAKPGKSAPRKYLELEDLNTFESPAKGPLPAAAGDDDTGSEEALEGVARSARPRKLTKRAAETPEKLAKQKLRPARQNIKKQRPGFLWTIARVTYETFNDTRSAFQQLNQIISESIPDAPAKKKPSSASLKKPIVKPIAKPDNSTTTTTTTTAEPEFKLTRPLLQSLVRRNVKGLVRLFNIEWRDAMDQSKKNAAEFRRELGNQIGMYLKDNPNNY